MKEELLQFIWRYQYFNQHELLSESGEPVQVVCPGELNTHQGPDFLHAQVRVGGTLLAGSIELHIVASDWRRHAHDGDLHYRNVVLHVVWENDRPVQYHPGDPTQFPGELIPARQTGSGCADDIPMLVLQDRIPKLLLGQYERWMKGRDFIPCHRQLPAVDQQLWMKWKQQLLLQRLQNRTLYIAACLDANQHHWEETAWWLLARNFGLPVNTAAFETIGKSLPIRLLARYRGDLFRMEALLLGQAGLLETDSGQGWRPSPITSLKYPQKLQREWKYLRALHHLSPIQTPLRFFRMRPAHFPTLRLAQLAALLSEHPAWFGAIRDAASPLDLEPWLGAATSEYWQTHYLLNGPTEEENGEPGASQQNRRSGRLGRQMKNSLLINTFVPLLFAYGQLRNEPAFCKKAVHWLEEAQPEKNAVLSHWESLGVGNKSAADSQALLELKNGYCQLRKCLSCAIGNRLLGRIDFAGG